MILWYELRRDDDHWKYVRMIFLKFCDDQTNQGSMQVMYEK